MMTQASTKEITGYGAQQEFVLRECCRGDGEILALLGAATFLETYAEVLTKDAILAHCRKHHQAERYESWLDESNVHIAVAEIHGVPVGYAVVCPVDASINAEPGDIELRRMYLLHRFHRAGIGKALMDWALDKTARLGYRRLVLGVYPGNTPAIKFYERFGFTRVGERKFQVGEMVFIDPVLARTVSPAQANAD
jgi:GNAT superfamily N-acetyltransferase